MSGDFSRVTFDPQKAYTQVLMQQGRVILDADWNEMQAIQNRKNETLVEDLIGSVAFPVKKPAFSAHVQGGLRFNGDADFVMIDRDGPHFDFNKSFSIEAKITLEQHDNAMAIVSQWQDAQHFNGECGFCFGVYPDGRLFLLRSIMHRRNLEIDELISTHPLKIGQNSQVAVTYNGRLVKLFIDGQCVGATEEQHTGYLEPAPTIIGASRFGNLPDRCFKGSISDVRIWSRCLRETEFDSDVFKYPKIGEIGLQAWWPLNEGAGDFARDISGHGFDGILGWGVAQNSPKWLQKQLTFSPGRMYLNGIMVEQFEPIHFTEPDLSDEGGYFLVFVQMRQVLINGGEDNDIIEPALGTETTLRQKTVLDIKCFPENGTVSSAELLAEAWQDYQQPLTRPGRLKATVLTDHPDFNNGLYRVEVYKTADLKYQQSLEVVWTADNSSLKFEVEDLKANRLTVFNLTHSNTVIKPGSYISLTDQHGVRLHQGDKLLKVTDVDYENEVIDFTGEITQPTGPVFMHFWRSDVCWVNGNDAGEYQLNIDNRLKLHFEPGAFYDEGSHWLIPARSVTNTLLWPLDCYQTMTGAARQLAPLAEFSFFGQTCWLHHDKRPYFYSATEGEAFIRKSGGTFTGSVTIDGDLTVNGDISDNCIGTEQLKDNAVDFHKIKGNLGLHLGQCVLSQSQVAPPGFSKVGKLTGDTESSSWGLMADQLPFAEPFTALNVGERVFILYGRGDVFEILQDPQTGQLELIEKCPREGGATRRFASCAHDNHIYVAGGEKVDGKKSDDFYRYSLFEDRWQKLHNLKHPTTHLSLCAGGPYIYAMGGIHNAFLGLLQHDPSHKNERYDPMEDEWHVMANIPDYRYSASAVEIDGKIHLIGGSDRQLSGLLSESFQSAHYVYDPQDDYWQEKAAIPLARSRFGAVVHDDKIVCMGGKTGTGYTGNVQVYNPQTDRWRSQASLNYPRSHVAAVILGDHLAALSGKTFEGYNSVIEEQILSTDFYVHRLDEYL
ncbi:MAG: hypothetical protein HRT35_25990 [Algicola sp.]|nr:hypothetical protein [Algicola sp.]